MWIVGAIAAGSIVLMGIIQIIVRHRKKVAEEAEATTKTGKSRKE
jgi:hypothetical protein